MSDIRLDPAHMKLDQRDAVTMWLSKLSRAALLRSEEHRIDRGDALREAIAFARAGRLVKHQEITLVELIALLPDEQANELAEVLVATGEDWKVLD